MLGWGLRQTSSNDSGGGGRAGTREWGRHAGADEGGPMMMITITVILEGWKSRHALLLALIHSAADFSYECLHDQRYDKLFSDRVIRISIRVSYRGDVLIFVNALFSYVSFCMHEASRKLENKNYDNFEETHPCRFCRRTLGH